METDILKLEGKYNGTDILKLERKFRAGFLSRRDFVGRAVAIVPGGIAGAEFLRQMLTPRIVRAASGITLDPTVDPLTQGYETDGNEPYTPGPRLVINDASAQGAPHLLRRRAGDRRR